MKLSSGLVFILLSFSAQAQFASPDNLPYYITPRDYTFPIQPGQKNSLSGSMGEIRNSHLHQGIDIRTNSTIGLPVIAPTDGYIAAAAISPTSYGTMLKLKHADDFTSLYAHLERFHPALEKYVEAYQYSKQVNELSLTFSPTQFPVKRGDTIAFSGNTGASAGPHLHFEVIAPDNKLINPLALKFNEIEDAYAPIGNAVALACLNERASVNQEFGRFKFHLRCASYDETEFYLENPILASGWIGIQVDAFDKMDKSWFRGGVNTIELWVNDKKTFTQNIVSFYEYESRNLLPLLDYSAKKNSGRNFVKLYQSDGNNFSFITDFKEHGKIHVQAGSDVPVKIILKDFFGNTSTIRFTLRYDDGDMPETLIPSTKQSVDWDVYENILKIESTYPDTELILFSSNKRSVLSPTYTRLRERVYLVSLKDIQPDSFQISKHTFYPNFKRMIPSGLNYTYDASPLQIRFYNNSLYDTLYFSAKTNDEEKTFSIGSLEDALKDTIRVTYTHKDLQPNQQWGVYRGTIFVPSKIANGSVTFFTRNMSTYKLKQDNVPPVITSIRANPNFFRCKISDNLSGIATYQAFVNDEWHILQYDQKTQWLFLKKKSKDEKLTGKIKLLITDRMGNQTEKIISIPKR